ncbi:hypothetical protein [Anatilimnocola floriformis]|uniref:hypothetical protein n=1 Tax=Anatilimnocola floriformis TaxID=2948575 RepID=UPI0020C4BF7C|nr:hypothetical protein [Anatilimnocola floriformis]
MFINCFRRLLNRIGIPFDQQQSSDLYCVLTAMAVADESRQDLIAQAAAVRDLLVALQGSGTAGLADSISALDTLIGPAGADFEDTYETVNTVLAALPPCHYRTVLSQRLNPYRRHLEFA